MLFTLGAAILLTGAPPTRPPHVPAEIAAYYRAYNFVNAFSTPSERRVLARSIAAPSDRRLAAVARALDQLVGRTEEVDPGMVRTLDPPGRLPRHEAEFSADIVRVISWSGDEVTGNGWIQLEVLALDQEVNGLLVAGYDPLTHDGRSMPEADQLIAVTRRPPMRTEEKYHWRRIDGEWQRAAGALIFTSR